ncbi:hypothetical protein PTKU46_92770 [Paraburkholderia terrae]
MRGQRSMTGFTMRSLLPDLLQFYARACDVVQDVSARRVSGAAPEPVARGALPQRSRWTGTRHRTEIAIFQA